MLPIKTIYSISELAKAAQMDTRRVGRFLMAHGVAIQIAGPRSRYVFLSDIRTRMPMLWESILEYEATQHLDDL